MHFTVPTNINTLPKANVLQTINTLIRILKCQLSLSTYISSAYYKQILVYNHLVFTTFLLAAYSRVYNTAQENLFYPIPAQTQ